MKPRATTEYIIIHCAATPPSMDIGVKEIDRWHRAKGWLGCGYHFVIRRDGTVEKGRDEKVAGAHVSGMNHNSIGICLVGGVMEKDKVTPENNFTEAQFTSMKSLVTDLLARYPGAKVRGHKDFAKKACPCFEVATYFPE